MQLQGSVEVVKKGLPGRQQAAGAALACCDTPFKMHYNSVQVASLQVWQ